MNRLRDGAFTGVITTHQNVDVVEPEFGIDYALESLDMDRFKSQCAPDGIVAWRRTKV